MYHLPPKPSLSALVRYLSPKPAPSEVIAAAILGKCDPPLKQPGSNREQRRLWARSLRRKGSIGYKGRGHRPGAQSTVKGPKY